MATIKLVFVYVGPYYGEIQLHYEQYIACCDSMNALEYMIVRWMWNFIFWYNPILP